MMTLARLVRVLLVLVLAVFAISFVIGVGSSATGAVEKLVLLAFVAGCIFLAARVPKLAPRRRARVQRR